MQKFQLTLRDFLRGAIVSILTSVYAVVKVTLEAGSLTFDWNKIATAAISGFFAYISMNFFTDSLKNAKKVLKKAELEGIGGGTNPPKEDRPPTPAKEETDKW